MFPMLMKNNCAVFQFRDCSFEVQKDREGAARVLHSSFRLPFGRNSTSSIASPFRSPSAAQISASISTITSMSTFTEKSLTPSANPFKTTTNPLRQRSRKPSKNFKIMLATLVWINLARTQKTLIIQETRMRSCRTRRRSQKRSRSKAGTQKTTSEAWKADRLGTIQMRRCHCLRRNCHQVLNPRRNDYVRLIFIISITHPPIHPQTSTIIQKQILALNLNS